MMRETAIPEEAPVVNDGLVTDTPDQGLLDPIDQPVATYKNKCSQ